jgi:type 1 glutamine amidotransferase
VIALTCSLLLALAPGDTVGGVPYERLETREATRDAMLARLRPTRATWGEWFVASPFPYAGHGKDDLRTAYPPEQQLARMRRGEAPDLSLTYSGKQGTPVRWEPLGRVAGERIDLQRHEDPALNDFARAYLYTTIESPVAQRLAYQMGSDDGCRFWLNGELLLDLDVPRGLDPTADTLELDLVEGTNHVFIEVAEGQGGWEYQVLTRQPLERRAEAELNHLLDRDFPPSPMRRHYTALTVPIPEGEVIEVGGLTVLPDGRPAVSTRRGDVFLVEDAYAVPPVDARFVRVAEGLHESLGLSWRAEESGPVLYTVQRGELTRLVDEDGDDVVDLYETFCDDWGVSGNYHEFAFGPKFDRDGNAWVTLNVGFCGSLGKSVVPWRGWAVKVTPDGRMIPVCDGLRSPNGIGMWKDGSMFYVDNQGDYVATNRLNHLAQGSFQGHPAGLRWREGYDPKADEPPARQLTSVWFPYRRMGQSAADIELDTTGGAFGPFEQQFFVGDQMNGSVMRVDLEQVDGHYQGACFPFVEGLDSGVNRLAFAPDGSLFVGQTDRGWGSLGDRSYGLQRIAWNGTVPFEVLHMNARTDGFDLEFTRDLDPETAADPASYRFWSFTYAYHRDYGAPETDGADLEVLEAVVLGPRRVRLVLSGMREGFVHELHADGVRSADGEPLVHPEAWYTLSVKPEPPKAARVDLRPKPRRLLFLTHSAGFVHGVVRRDAPEELSHAERELVAAAGRRFEVVPTQDCSLIRPEVLETFDAVLFYTTGSLPISEENRRALVEWVADGGAFVGIHCATDTMYECEPYMEMIGGAFDGHPWHEEVSLVVEDREHPATRHLGERWRLTDEIYQFKWFRRFPLQGLLHLSGDIADLSKGKRADRDNVNAWCKPWGEGRVFYTALGHRPEVWTDPEFRRHLLGGVRWAIEGPDRPVPAPQGAVQLLGEGAATAWTTSLSGELDWLLADGVLTVAPGTGNTVSRRRFGDALIHLEFSPSEHGPEVTGQARGNSGLYIHGNYELQVLDSHGLAAPGAGDCGAIYGVSAPLTPDAYRPAGEWSSYDVEFTAPRFDADGNKVANARITAWLNGRLVQDDVEVPGPTTAALYGDEMAEGPLMLQDHGNPVRYRNLWVLPR